MTNLITEHLLLRKAKLADLEKIWHNIWEDKSIYETMLFKPTDNLEEAIDRLNRTIEYQSTNYAYFVCLKTNDEPIGFAGISEKESEIYEETGICIAVNHQGKGYAKEVVEALKFLVFEKITGNRFLYGCFSTNDKSKKVCLSQGFKYLNSQTTIRQWDNKEFIIDYYFDKNMYKSNLV